MVKVGRLVFEEDLVFINPIERNVSFYTFTGKKSSAKEKRK
jgi:hypothetical protein